ncbi:hypothetical protein ACUL41_06650 [Virgibacillus natechei]
MAIINQCFLINVANTIPIGAITKVIEYCHRIEPAMPFFEPSMTRK